MPYRTNDDLPEILRRRLPPHAQNIYRAAFNDAYRSRLGDPKRDVAAHRIAWGAVKRSYLRVGSRWIARAQMTDDSFTLH